MTEHGNVDDARRVALESLLSADLRVLATESDRVGRMFASSQDVSSNDFHGLLHIMAAETAGAPLTAGQLRKLLGVSAAAITYLADRLIVAGHVRREGDPDDRRKVVLRYEPAGTDVADAFFAPMDSHLRSALGEVSDDDLVTAHRVFEGLADGLRSFRDDIGAP